MQSDDYIGWVSSRLASAKLRPSSDYDLNAEGLAALPEGRRLRPAAVLIGLLPRSDGFHVLLTRRSSALKHHPGQIAFPGGKCEDADASAIDTSLREAREEIGLPEAQVLGTLPPHETVTGFSVTPVVAQVSPFTSVLQQSEVAELFEVPLAALLASERYYIRSRRWRGAERYFYAVPYGPYYIWGATARILRQFSDVLS